MIDVNTLKNKIIKNRIKIPNENISIEYKPIIFFLQKRKMQNRH